MDYGSIPLSDNEIERLKNEELHARRKQRLLEVRAQEKALAAKRRHKFKQKLAVKENQLVNELEAQWLQKNHSQLNSLATQYKSALSTLGTAHRSAIHENNVMIERASEKKVELLHRQRVDILRHTQALHEVHRQRQTSLATVRKEHGNRRLMTTTEIGRQQREHARESKLRRSKNIWQQRIAEAQRKQAELDRSVVIENENVVVKSGPGVQDYTQTRYHTRVVQHKSKQDAKAAALDFETQHTTTQRTIEEQQAAYQKSSLERGQAAQAVLDRDNNKQAVLQQLDALSMQDRERKSKLLDERRKVLLAAKAKVESLRMTGQSAELQVEEILQPLLVEREEKVIDVAVRVPSVVEDTIQDSTKEAEKSVSEEVVLGGEVELVSAKEEHVTEEPEKSFVEATVVDNTKEQQEASPVTNTTEQSTTKSPLDEPKELQQEFDSTQQDISEDSGIVLSGDTRELLEQSRKARETATLELQEIISLGRSSLLETTQPNTTDDVVEKQLSSSLDAFLVDEDYNPTQQEDNTQQAVIEANEDTTALEEGADGAEIRELAYSVLQDLETIQNRLSVVNSPTQPQRNAIQEESNVAIDDSWKGDTNLASLAARVEHLLQPDAQRGTEQEETAQEYVSEEDVVESQEVEGVVSTDESWKHDLDLESLALKVENFLSQSANTTQVDDTVQDETTPDVDESTLEQREIDNFEERLLNVLHTLQNATTSNTIQEQSIETTQSLTTPRQHGTTQRSDYTAKSVVSLGSDLTERSFESVENPIPQEHSWFDLQVVEEDDTTQPKTTELSESAIQYNTTTTLEASSNDRFTGDTIQSKTLVRDEPKEPTVDEDDIPEYNTTEVDYSFMHNTSTQQNTTQEEQVENESAILPKETENSTMQQTQQRDDSNNKVQESIIQHNTIQFNRSRVAQLAERSKLRAQRAQETARAKELKRKSLQLKRLNTTLSSKPSTPLSQASSISPVAQANSPLLKRLVTGTRVSLSRSEMRAQNSRLYSKLPEVVKLENEKAKKEQARLRREKVKQLEQQRRDKLLRKR